MLAGKGINRAGYGSKDLQSNKGKGIIHKAFAKLCCWICTWKICQYIRSYQSKLVTCSRTQNSAYQNLHIKDYMTKTGLNICQLN